jgi:hypothetical protein
MLRAARTFPLAQLQTHLPELRTHTIVTFSTVVWIIVVATSACLSKLCTLRCRSLTAAKERKIDAARAASPVC